MRCRQANPLVRACVEPLEPRLLLSGGVVISEFLAANGGSLLDGDDEASDWIEIRNTGDSPASLGGMFLSDAAAELMQWPIPTGITLAAAGDGAAGDFLIVFASGQDVTDYVDPLGYLHTNFKLSRNDGGQRESVLLSREASPGVAEVVHGFVDYPEQVEDVAYGLADQIENQTLIDAGDGARTFVPTDDSQDATWTGPTFDDSSWRAGTTGVGFDLVTGGSTPPGLIAYWAFDETTDGGAFTPDATGRYAGSVFGATLTSGAGGRFGEAMAFDGDNDYITAGVVSEMKTPDTFTISAWFNRTTDRTDDTNHNVNNIIVAQSSDSTNDNFELGSQGGDIEVYLDTAAKDGPNPSIRQGVGVTDGGWHHVVVTYDRTRANEVALYFDGVRVGQYSAWGGAMDSSATSPLTIGMARPGGSAWGDFAGLIDDVAIWDEALSDAQVAALAGGGSPLDLVAFDGLIGTDVGDEAHGAGTSAYTRIAFDADRDPAEFYRLTLAMKYDDAFVAYLNGVEVARRNVTGVAAFDSVASTERLNMDAIVYETIDITAHTGLLTETGNVLAVHAINVSADDNDLLIVPTLNAFVDLGVEQRYFATPTPGGGNNESFAGFLPEPAFSVDRGMYEASFPVELSVEATDVTIRYTTDGNAPTATTGELYTGVVTVETTTVLRAAVFRPGYKTGDVITHTYLFLDDVLDQPTAPAGFPAVWGPVPADYEMDPRIVIDDPVFSTQVRDALEALPTMSLAIDAVDMWDSSVGIYANTLEHGRAWEKPVSVEMIGFADATDAQVNAGLRIQGGASRSTSRPKHNMRLIFRSEYGPGKLEFPLFGDREVTQFDQVNLRGGNGDAWIHPTSTQRTRSQYIRDQWHRDVQELMGTPTSYQSYAHLYINGLYWGLYHLIERPDASFMEEHLGGQAEDYDVLRHKNETVDGDRGEWDAMMAIVRAGGLDLQDNYNKVLNYINPADLADYMLLNFYSGNVDWDQNNWFGGRKREDGATWQFFSWDSERTFWSVTQDSTGFKKTNQPTEVHQALTANADYVRAFGDQVHKHFFNGGVLTSEVVESLWVARANEIALPLVAESARWGDHHRAADPYTPTEEWAAELAGLQANYFPVRTGIVLDQLRARGLYPATTAPSFAIDGLAQHGGTMDPAALLTMSPQAGIIFYTLDGTDPVAGGPGVRIYDGTPISPAHSTHVKARTLENGIWSALNEASFYVNPPVTGDLAVTELNYNPAPPTIAELATQSPTDAPFTAGDFEFVELRNVSDRTVDLLGVDFAAGVEFTFASGDAAWLAPNDYAVLVSNVAAFRARYGPSVPIAGAYANGLDRNGERLALGDPFGGLLAELAYDNSGAWPGRADGKGATLVVIDTAGDPNDPANWNSSVAYGGTPGASPQADLGVVVNEVLSHTDLPSVDTIELHNTTAADINLGGWFLSDSSGWDATGVRGNYTKFRIPDDTVIVAGGYRTFDEDDFNTSLGADPEDFALNGAHGDDVWLMKADPSGKLTHFADHVEVAPAANGETLGRWPDATGDLVPMTAPTLGQSNASSTPRVGPVVISEVMYHPVDPDGDGPIEADDLEFIELFNPTAQTIHMARWQDNPDVAATQYFADWRLRGGVDMEFDEGVTLGAGRTLVVLSFDPDKPENASRVATFRSHYGIGGEVDLAGGYEGQLDNGGERITLQRPDSPPLGEADFVPHYIEDEVTYDDLSPWPAEAAGNGEALHRVDAQTWGDQSAAWIAEAPTPGSVSFTVTTLTWDGHDGGDWTSTHWNAEPIAPSGGEAMLVDSGTVTISTDVTVSPGAAATLTIAAAAGGGTVSIAPAGVLGVTGQVDVGSGGTLSVDGTLSAARVSVTGGLLTNTAGQAGVLTINSDVELTGETTFVADLLNTGVDTLVTTGAITISPSASLGIVLAGGDGLFRAGTYTLIQAGGGLTGQFANVTALGAYVSMGGNGLTYDEAAGTLTLTLDMALHPGDGNLDGATDVSDRIIWNNSNFTEASAPITASIALDAPMPIALDAPPTNASPSGTREPDAEAPLTPAPLTLAQPQSLDASTVASSTQPPAPIAPSPSAPRDDSVPSASQLEPDLSPGLSDPLG